MNATSAGQKRTASGLRAFRASTLPANPSAPSTAESPCPVCMVERNADATRTLATIWFVRASIGKPIEPLAVYLARMTRPSPSTTTVTTNSI